MDISQQIFLFLLGLATGIVIGMIIGVLIQRRRGTVDTEAPQPEPTEIPYGTVNPDQIHTLPGEVEEGKEELKKVCPVCGHENPADNLFCFDCGGRLY